MTAQDLRNLIGAGKTPQAIEHLKTLSHWDNDNQNMILLLANRFAIIQREKISELSPIKMLILNFPKSMPLC